MAGFSSIIIACQVMHCSCDDRFRSCLKLVDSQASSIVGNFFFNVGNTKCFVFKMEEVNQIHFYWIFVIGSLLHIYMFKYLHFYFEVCEKRNWWGVCLKRVKQAKAVWRQPVAY